MDNQGVVIIYTLEKYLDKYQDWYYLEPSLKDTGEPYLGHFASSRELWAGNPLEMAFSASADCWQKYGIKGTLNEDVAKEVAKACTKNGLKVRIIKRTYYVQAEAISY